MNNFNINNMDNFNVANFLQGAPTGLILYSKSLDDNVEFNKVIAQHTIECLRYDDTDSLIGEQIYFDAYGRIKNSFFGNILNTDVDLMPGSISGWDNAGISALITGSYKCVGKVLIDKFPPNSNSEFPWIVGDTAMWSFDDEWESVRFHKFDFSNVRFANMGETIQFFDCIHRYGCDFKDGTPIKKGENVEPECRDADKEQFFNALSDLYEDWKRTIPDHDFQEVLFKFETEVIFPEIRKAFG